MTRLPPPAPVPDIEREMLDGYRAACVRWGAEPEGGRAMLDPEHGATLRPQRGTFGGGTGGRR